MSKENLYKFFSCESKEELYNKLRSRDEEVRSLHDFIEFSKGDLEDCKKPVRSVEDAGALFVRYDMPEKEECKLVFVNTKNKPVHVGDFNVRDEVGFRTLLKDGLNAGGVNTLFLHNETSSRDVGGVLEGRLYNGVEDYLEVINLRVLDRLSYVTNDEGYEGLYSYKGRERYSLASLKNLSGRYTESEGHIYSVSEEKKYEDFGGFEEFSSYFARKEIVGLNMFGEFDDIQDALKVGYQFDHQEIFGLITCDSDGYVLSLKEMFKGSVNATVADVSVFAKEVLNDDRVAYASVFHNHPSGNPEPSSEDLLITKRFDKVSEGLDVGLLDHLVVGKEYVLSMAVESDKLGVDSPLASNERYKESVISIREKNKSYGKQLTLNTFVKGAGDER